MAAAASRVAAVKAGMVTACAASVQQYLAAIDRLKAALDAHRDEYIRDALSLRDERVKTLDANAEELLVSAAQLRACGNMCRHPSSLASSDAATSALTSANMVMDGLCVPPSPTPSLFTVGLRVNESLVMNALNTLSVVVRSGVHPQHSRVCGIGLSSFLSSSSPRHEHTNTFEVSCLDVDGAEGPCLGLTDISISTVPPVDDLPIVWSIFLAPAGSGFTVTYAVKDNSLLSFTLSSIRVCGVELLRAACTPHRCDHFKGILSRSFIAPGVSPNPDPYVYDWYSNSLVSIKRDLLVFYSDVSCTVTVYKRSTGELLAQVDGPAVGDHRFSRNSR